MSRILSLLSVLIIVGCAGSSVTEGPLTEKHLDFAAWHRTPECCTAKGRKVAVASGGTYSSKAAIEIVDKGGNAVDAAVATAFCLAVERPHSLGLGGGGFMTMHLADKTPSDYFVDFRETAPAKAKRDMYLGKDGKVVPKLSTLGALAVATPGFVAGMWEIHQKWGKLPWKQVVAPAVRLARDGFPIYHSLAKHIVSAQKDFAADGYLAGIFLRDGQPLKEGETLVQADLAKTIEQIGERGKAAFYSGDIANKIAATVKQGKGILDKKDLAAYKPKERVPLVGTFGNHLFITAPPPSAGGVMFVEMLNVLSGFDLEKISHTPSQYAQLLGEVMKRGYADRSAFIGDPDFAKTGYEKLLSPIYADDMRPKINLAKSTPSSEIRPAGSPANDHGTTHLSIISASGDAVSSTLTINDIFGARLGVPGTGIILNNEMDDFSSKPGEPNVYGLTGAEANGIAPFKRPVSSMTPTIVLEGGKPVLAVGGAGGSRIISSVFQVMLNDLVIYKHDLRRALFAPRVHHQWLPDKLDLEEGFPEQTAEKLRAMGNKVGPWDWRAIVHAVGRDESGTLTAVFDPRDEGGVEAR